MDALEPGMLLGDLLDRVSVGEFTADRRPVGGVRVNGWRWR
jgi:hypothetical protein